MEPRTIYAVSERSFEPNVKYSAFFDSFDEAVRFSRKFNENTDFDIIPVTVNQHYPTDKERSPYMALFKLHPSFEGEPEIYLDDQSHEHIAEYTNASQVIRAGDEEGGAGIPEVTFFFMAKGADEARRIAFRRKEELIQDGLWPASPTHP